jgi:hypothetical protein
MDISSVTAMLVPQRELHVHKSVKSVMIDGDLAHMTGQTIDDGHGQERRLHGDMKGYPDHDPNKVSK